MTFSEYLISKKIDGERFLQSEPQVFRTWEAEFEEMHPNSFTVQKLNLINPIRRKYQLKDLAPTKVNDPQPLGETKPTSAAPRIVKPMFKPKPKSEGNV